MFPAFKAFSKTDGQLLWFIEVQSKRRAYRKVISFLSFLDSRTDIVAFRSAIFNQKVCLMVNLIKEKLKSKNQGPVSRYEK